MNADRKPRIGIIGSCVSRDPFELKRDKYHISFYIARSSFASMFGESFKSDVPLHLISSPWQRSSVECDIRKLARTTIIDSIPDILVIDFIDERFGLLDSAGTVATLSLPMAELLQGEYGDATFIRNSSKVYRELWLKGWKEFVRIVRSIGLAEKCVLHKVRWASHDSMGQAFKEDLVKAGNRNLEWCYEEAKASFPELKVIEPADNHLVGDINHKWGPAPYHYMQTAQSYFLEELNVLIKAEGFVI